MPSGLNPANSASHGMEWRLCPTLFQQLQQAWGRLTMDCFASDKNYQLPRIHELEVASRRHSHRCEVRPLVFSREGLPVFSVEPHSSRTVLGRANHSRVDQQYVVSHTTSYDQDSIMDDSEASRTSSTRKQQRESATEESELETSRLKLRRLRPSADGLDDDVQTIILHPDS
ncbi:hypothetical protein RMATCC62417_14378 [Rhizopus microsporus]|nr:hypothetical protein RMATCC62417_14378 [Rhizopus microsporus]